MEMQGIGGQGQMVGGRIIPMMSQSIQSHQQHAQMMGQTQHPQILMGQGQPQQMMSHGGLMGQPGVSSPMQGHAAHHILPGPQPPMHQGTGGPTPAPGGQELPKLDNISKAKSLMPTIKESVAVWEKDFISITISHFTGTGYSVVS